MKHWIKRNPYTILGSLAIAAWAGFCLYPSDPYKDIIDTSWIDSYTECLKSAHYVVEVLNIRDDDAKDRRSYRFEFLQRQCNRLYPVYQD